MSIILNKELAFLEKALIDFEKANPEVSSSNVGWHIDHSLRVIESVNETLMASNPSDYKWKFNKWRFIIFIKGVFPRGKVRAPKKVQPSENVTVQEVENKIEKVKTRIDNLVDLPPKSNFKHPIFGTLNLKKSIRFLEMHTHHHMHIIKDILNDK